MQTRHRPLIIGGYVCYALALFAVFAYIKFPAQQVRAMVLTRLDQHGLEQLHIGAVRPLLPLGLGFRGMSLVREVGGQRLELLHIADLRLYWHTFWPLAQARRLRFAADLYGGSMLGTVAWRARAGDPRMEIQAHFRDLRLGMSPVVAKLDHATVEGKLTGDMTLQLSAARWPTGTGHLTLRSEGGRVSGLELMEVTLPSLTYEHLVGDIEVQTHNVIVRNLLVRGRDWQFGAQGKVGFAEQIAQSTLDITLQVQASDAFEQQLGVMGLALKGHRDQRGFASLRVGGTLGKPRLNL